MSPSWKRPGDCHGVSIDMRNKIEKPDLLEHSGFHQSKNHADVQLMQAITLAENCGFSILFSIVIMLC